MKNAERKLVMVPMYGSKGQEIMVRLTRLEREEWGDMYGVWYITEREYDALIKDYNRVSFQDPRMDTVTRLPEGINFVIVLRRDNRYFYIYKNPAVIY